jgi:ADP-ribosyl-[dinitrogen reductase] hydrolase
MRAGIIGAFFSQDAERRAAYVTASTQLTHTDPKANWAALAIAECTALEMNDDYSIGELKRRLVMITDDPAWQTLMREMFSHLADNRSVMQFADSLGLAKGVTGYALHSAPVAIFAWVRHRPDAEMALSSALTCGGDTDSVGALIGAIAGAGFGSRCWPKTWVDRISDWPFGVANLRRIACGVAEFDNKETQSRGFSVIWPLMFVRNMVVLVLVLGHGVRRLLPPYG